MLGDIVLWTSLAAAGGAVLASAVTAIVTYVLTKRSIEAAKAEGDATRRYEIEQAWTERDQTRKLDAYLSVTRYVQNWMRQIGYVISKASFQFDPPLQQPEQDRLAYEQEALVVLVGSELIVKALQKFNKLVTNYITTMGMYKKMHEMVSESQPASADVASSWWGKTTDAARAVNEAGKAIIDQMVMEIQGSRV